MQASGEAKAERNTLGKWSQTKCKMKMQTRTMYNYEYTRNMYAEKSQRSEHNANNVCFEMH